MTLNDLKANLIIKQISRDFFENGLGFCRGLTIRTRRLTYCLFNSVVLELHKEKTTHKKLVL